MTEMEKFRACVIGAGPSGLTAAKALREAGIEDFVVLEKGDAIGGNWVYDTKPGHSSVFETTHLISSKRLSKYSDFSMPEDYPEYPGQRLVLQYFQRYTDKFDLLRHIRFETELTHAEPQSGGGWLLTLADGSRIAVDNLIVANGHHWAPREPQYQGEFTGEWMHAHAFKNNKGFEGKRVLVIGGGNSGCDIAVETGRVSEYTAISMRRGYYFIPKILFGRPSDMIRAKLQWLPERIRNGVMQWALGIINGPYAKYGMAAPDYRLFVTHPVVNSELLYFIKHGDVEARPDIERFEGRTVHFKDGSSTEFDTVIAATGYHIRFPFLGPDVVDWEEADVPLYLRTVDASRDDLFFIGLIQPNGAIWPLSELQAKISAAAITGRWQRPADIGERVRREIADIKHAYMDTPRHTIEVDYHDYFKRLEQELASIG